MSTSDASFTQEDAEHIAAQVDVLAEPSRDEDVIAALRLAVKAAATPEALRRVVVALLEKAPATDPRLTASVHLLIEATKEAGHDRAD